MSLSGRRSIPDEAASYKKYVLQEEWVTKSAFFMQALCGRSCAQRPPASDGGGYVCMDAIRSSCSFLSRIPYVSNAVESGSMLKLLHHLGLDVSLQEDLMCSIHIEK